MNLRDFPEGQPFYLPRTGEKFIKGGINPSEPWRYFVYSLMRKDTPRDLNWQCHVKPLVREILA